MHCYPRQCVNDDTIISTESGLTKSMSDFYILQLLTRVFWHNSLWGRISMVVDLYLLCLLLEFKIFTAVKSLYILV